MKKKIYIAGPMRGMPQFNYPAFDAAEEWLALQGWEVVDPAKMGKEYGTPAQIDADLYLLQALMNAELFELEECHAIFLLRGWEKSVGARDELAVALRRGLEIVLQEVG